MLTVVTGYPGSGKSDLVDQIALNLARAYEWNTVYCSFEKPAELHITQLAEKLTGRPFFKGPNLRMSEHERDWALHLINKHFAFMDYRRGGPSDIDGILERASAAVMRMGSRLLVIDPYNYITLDRHEKMETDIISDMLTQVQQWAKQHDCHVMFVAHPAKRFNQAGDSYVPTGHDIAKSAAWYAKADIGLTVTRDVQRGTQTAHVWKMKWSWMGKQGRVDLGFDPVSSRWFDIDPMSEDDWGNLV
jgi:twinkle protein